MPHRVRRRDPVVSQNVTGLTDAQIHELLADLRAAATRAATADYPAIESAIAALECEAARRDLAMENTAIEVMPPVVAFHVFERGLSRLDVADIERALPCLDVGGLWKAFQRVRRLEDPAMRTDYLECLLYLVDCMVFSPEAAARRRARLEAMALRTPDYEEYLEQCLNAGFGVLLLR